MSDPPAESSVALTGQLRAIAAVLRDIRAELHEANRARERWADEVITILGAGRDTP